MHWNVSNAAQSGLVWLLKNQQIEVTGKGAPNWSAGSKWKEWKWNDPERLRDRSYTLILLLHPCECWQQWNALFVSQHSWPRARIKYAVSFSAAESHSENSISLNSVKPNDWDYLPPEKLHFHCILLFFPFARVELATRCWAIFHI